jgi:hypothetical protein
MFIKSYQADIDVKLLIFCLFASKKIVIYINEHFIYLGMSNIK